MTTIDINALTAEQKKELFNQLEEQQKAEIKKRKETLEAMEKIAIEVLFDSMELLEDLSEEIITVKSVVYRNFMDYLRLKVEELGKTGQKSHTINFGGKKLILGYNEIDGYSDDAIYGIEKVHKFLGTLATDEKTAKFLRLVYRLLSKNANGDLDSKNVLKLLKIAKEDYPNTEFQEGVEIIHAAHRPRLSKWFIKAFKTDNTGIEVALPLSVTDAKLPKDIDLSFLLPKKEDNEQQ